LDGWEYDPEKNIRIITADDGRKVLQVRQPMGIEQYELDGRPDGKVPNGFASVLEEVEEYLSDYTEIYGGDEGFHLSLDQYAELREEGVLYYYRYLVLFQISDYERTIRDTEHNLRICDLIEKYADMEQERFGFLEYKPYILRMNAMAQAMVQLKSKSIERAREILEYAIENIQSMNAGDNPTYQFEKLRSINTIKSALDQMKGKPFDPVEHLQKQLEEAVENENYEQAAELRDEIKHKKENGETGNE